MMTSLGGSRSAWGEEATEIIIKLAFVSNVDLMWKMREKNSLEKLRSEEQSSVLRKSWRVSEIK